MIELGQLEQAHEAFAKRGIRVYAISNDDQETAAKTQADFPHLIFVSDKDLNIAEAMQVVHKAAGREGKDINAPTTFLVDGAGTVRWLFRPDRFTERLTPTELLNAIDQTWQTTP